MGNKINKLASAILTLGLLCGLSIAANAQTTPPTQ